MLAVCSINNCTGCMACKEICGRNAINIIDSIYAYNAVINEELCINCGLCHNICPCNKPVNKCYPIKWFQGWACSSIREYASSGGVATAIIKTFIEQGGYVASCIFNEGKFCFDITNDLEKVTRFAGSKYVKSNPANVYKAVRNLLKKDMKVLFLGLPCQVAGLKNYLNLKDSNNLYTVDLICHGTPSPKILNMFLQEENIDIRQIKDIRFRRKNSYGISIKEKEDNYSLLTDYYIQDLYTYAFLSSLDYTENCYSCVYAGIERVGDITLGDSWGSNQPNEEKKKGVSLILCQTEKGVELIKNANLTLHKVELEKAIKSNQQLVHPSQLPYERTVFFKYLPLGFHKAIKRSLPVIYYKKKFKLFIKKVNSLFFEKNVFKV